MSSKKPTDDLQPEPGITRRKLAQMRRRQREKNAKEKLKALAKEKSVKPKVDLKKSDKDEKTVERVKKSKKMYSNRRKRHQSIHEPKEFYPNKMKRALNVAKIVLKPKYTLKKIGNINKRKLRQPQRGSDFQPQPLSNEEFLIPLIPKVPKDLSIEELMMRNEEDMTDEDFMEILTCPSPVWWEEMDGVCEEPLKNCKIPTETSPPNEEIETVVNIPDSPTEALSNLETVAKKDDRFLKKRKTLENLLNNIKNKDLSKKPTSPNSLEDFGQSEDVLKELENLDIPIERRNDCTVSDETCNNYESPKAMIWTSETGEKKIVNFVTSSSPDVTENVTKVTCNQNSDVPNTMPILQWYPKTGDGDKKPNTSSKIDKKSENCKKVGDKNPLNDQKVAKTDLRQMYLKLTRPEIDRTTDATDSSVSNVLRSVKKLINKKSLNEKKFVKSLEKIDLDNGEQDYVTVYKIVENNAKISNNAGKIKI